jgi:hypothetical protein
MKPSVNEPFTSEESQEIYQNFKTIINSRLDKLYDEKKLMANNMLIVLPLNR